MLQSNVLKNLFSYEKSAVVLNIDIGTSNMKSAHVGFYIAVELTKAQQTLNYQNQRITKTPLPLITLSTYISCSAY